MTLGAQFERTWSSGESPFLVALEGPDGAGKTTIAREVNNRLRGLGFSCTVKAEFPEGRIREEMVDGLTHGLFLPEQLKMAPEATFFFLLYAQAQSVIATSPAALMLADRYLWTTSLYQTSFVDINGRKPDAMAVLALLEQLFLHLALPLPARTVLLDAPVETLVRRLEMREGRKISNREAGILDSFRASYLAMAKLRQETTLVVNAEDPRESVVDAVVQYILSARSQTS